MVETKQRANLSEQVAELLQSVRGDRQALIMILQKVQENFGYIPPETLPQIAKSLRISESEIFGVATFYMMFRFTPPGEHNVKVCLGTACHVRGGARILEEVERELGIEPGETTPDHKFELERVACVGCCALAPVMVIDGTIYGKMDITKTKRVLAKYR